MLKNLMVEGDENVMLYMPVNVYYNIIYLIIMDFIENKMSKYVQGAGCVVLLWYSSGLGELSKKMSYLQWKMKWKS